MTLHLSYGEKNKYVALSHCWGPSQPFILTTASETAFRNGIPFQALPRTFQDAVTITRLLCLRYLWIDSLCILQDDKDDWERESANMADVYRNAYLTIAASNAASHAEGFLQPRAPSSAVCGFDGSDGGRRPIGLFQSYLSTEKSLDWPHGVLRKSHSLLEPGRYRNACCPAVYSITVLIRCTGSVARSFALKTEANIGFRFLRSQTVSRYSNGLGLWLGMRGAH